MSISLAKNGKISLKKEAPNLQSAFVGLGWDPADGRSEIDLDANVFALDASGNVVAVVFFNEKKAFKLGGGFLGMGGSYAIVHHGDNRTGDGDGDDEVISLNLAKMPAQVKHLVVTITSYEGQRFTDVENAFVRVVNEADDKEVCKYVLSDKYPNTGMIMGTFTRTGDGWEFTANGQPANGRTYRDQERQVSSLIG